MLLTLLSRLGWFLLLCLLQVFVFNHVHIAGAATPMPYVYMLLLLTDRTPRWAYVLTGFLLGLVIDVFSNTPGMAAASCCLTGLLAPPLLKGVAPETEDNEVLTAAAAAIGWGRFLLLSFSVALVNCSAFFLVESFSFFNWPYLLTSIAGSTALTWLFLIAMELIRNGCKK